ncbi:hypothetical protein Aglo01_62600 [Actinokineospora globicatena]|nr:hypothetical protein Aglo01_62600 [Actinokineospora globicatena]
MGEGAADAPGNAPASIAAAAPAATVIARAERRVRDTRAPPRVANPVPDRQGGAGYRSGSRAAVHRARWDLTEGAL